jgi:hypothetical protein
VRVTVRETEAWANVMCACTRFDFEPFCVEREKSFGNIHSIQRETKAISKKISLRRIE